MTVIVAPDSGPAVDFGTPSRAIGTGTILTAPQ